MKVVTEPLRSNQSVNAQKWYTDAMSSVRGMVGSGHYELPYNDDDRTVLLYQFFLMIERNSVDISRFCLAIFGTSKYQEGVHRFNQELVLKFTREVSYRLDEILQDLGDKQFVPKEAMFVFHNHGHTMNIHGNVQGSNIAIGKSSISDSSANYTTNEELASAFKALKPLLHDVAVSQRDAVEAAIGVLMKASADPSISANVVEKAASTASSASPTVKERLIGIVEKVGSSLVATAVIQGIKMGLNLP